MIAPARTAQALGLLAALSLGALSRAEAQEAPPSPEAKAQWDAEVGIERALAEAQVRGMLGKKPPAADWTPRRAGEGRLERGPEGVPILYLRGTPEEMGRQHGTLLKNEVGAMRAYVKTFVGPKRYESARSQAAALFGRHLPDRYRREAAALAEAVEMPLDELLFAQWFTDIYRSFACSTVAAPRSREGGPFLARNLDFPTLGFLQRYSLVIVAQPEGKRAFASVGWPGLIGVLSGQNGGVALSVLVVHDAFGARSGLPFQLALRAALEEAEDAAGVEAFLRSVPLTVTNNLAVVDGGGEARILELSPGEIWSKVSREGPLTTTNHFRGPGGEVPRVSFSYLSSKKRLGALERRCPGQGPLPSRAEARLALKEAGVEFTAQSMVFLPREGALEVAFTSEGSAAERAFVRLGPELLLGGR